MIAQRPPSPADQSGVALDLLQSLWALAHALDSMSRRMDATIGLSGPQRLAMRLIAAEPGGTALALSERLHIHPSTTTGLLDRLERKGLVQRERRPEDRRAYSVRATEAGIAALAVPGPTIEEVLGDFLFTHPRVDPLGLRQSLDQLTGALLQAAANPARPLPDGDGDHV
ncbi:MAG TPA: MarR family transcriptional regulator [Myxococcota bacterium]|nr:MarR family transcriptional regulator [Myxococcota bacterium]